LCRASTSFFSVEDVDGRDEPGHDGLWSHSGAREARTRNLEMIISGFPDVQLHI
jgi:hypothetical protein